MNPTQDTDRVMLATPPNASLTEQVEAGEKVAELLEHPGFKVLADVIETHRQAVLSWRVLHKPDADAASYADAIGHLRGLDEFVPLARGVVQNGEFAAQTLRQKEDL